MNKKALVIGGIVVIVAAAGIAFALNNKKEDTAETTPAPVAQTQTTEDTTDNPAAVETSSATITYTSSGFSPASITVKKGAMITIKNDSSRTIQFDSDPHPQHTNNTELNVDKVEAGKSMTFVVDKTGTWGYHDHLRSSEKGTIIVQ